MFGDAGVLRTVAAHVVSFAAIVGCMVLTVLGDLTIAADGAFLLGFGIMLGSLLLGLAGVAVSRLLLKKPP